MTIESATFIADLQPVNPPSTDPVSQGDDHIRLIKQVLQNQFGGAARQWQIPSGVFVNVSFPIPKSQGETYFFCAPPGAPITLTLPSLTTADMGWSCSIIKYTPDPNPVFIAPPAGYTLYSGQYTVAKARRSIPGTFTKVFFAGSSTFIANRTQSLPIGSMIDFYGSTLPIGYEWPSGQTLAIANYPEYAQAISGAGTTPDVRGCTCAALDNLGGTAAGRLTGNFINPNALGSIGGSDFCFLTLAQIPAHQHAVYLGQTPHSHGNDANQLNAGSGTPGPFTVSLSSRVAATISPANANLTLGSSPGANDGLTNVQGSSSFHSSLQPTVMCSKILVVE